MGNAVVVVSVVFLEVKFIFGIFVFLFSVFARSGHLTPHQHHDDDDDDHSLRIINIHNLKRNRDSRLVIRKLSERGEPLCERVSVLPSFLIPCFFFLFVSRKANRLVNVVDTPEWACEGAGGKANTCNVRRAFPKPRLASTHE